MLCTKYKIYIFLFVKGSIFYYVGNTVRMHYRISSIHPIGLTDRAARSVGQSNGVFYVSTALPILNFFFLHSELYNEVVKLRTLQWSCKVQNYTMDILTNSLL